MAEAAKAPAGGARSGRRMLSAVAAQLAGSVLAGEEGFGRRALDDAARFVLAAATQRDAGKAAIATSFALREGNSRKGVPAKPQFSWRLGLARPTPPS